jgi:hypothetical protein
MYIDTFTGIDMRGVRMPRLFDFCERCSNVRDAGCRRATLRERALLQAWRYGARI